MCLKNYKHLKKCITRGKVIFELTTGFIFFSDNKPAVCEHILMTPACILERKRIFYNYLLDITKKYHEVIYIHLK